MLGNQGVLRRLQDQGVVNTPGDRHEREADQAAQQVMQTSGGCTCGGSCSKCRGKPEAHSDAPAKAPPVVQEALRAPGRALDMTTRAFMESRFGRDFSGVRIHTDAASAQSAKAMQARACTVGSDSVPSS